MLSQSAWYPECMKNDRINSLPQDVALKLLKQGKIALSPEVREAYEERSAIMEYDAGLSRDQADRYAWCRVVCMLTRGQAENCNAVKPCPRYIED